jgi:hypothetical protein
VTDRVPIYVATNEAGQPTSLSKFASTDFVPEENGGTGTSSISRATGLIYDSSAGTLTTASDVDTVLLTGGAEKLIARVFHVSNTLSGSENSLVRFDGTFSAMSGISVSGPEGLSSNDAGKAFYFRRQDGASYANLIRAEDGTITLQAEDDIHLKSNSGEDFARFNENAAVWLYYDNSKKIETHNQGAVITGGLSATTMEASTCPIPNPVCYAQMGGAGTAGSTEIKFGAGVTPTTTNDSSDQIVWDNSNSEFDIAADGTYHVLATLVLTVGTSTLPTIRIKEGSNVKNHYLAHGIHSAEDPEEVTIQAAFACAAGESITVTFEDDASTNINLERGSAVTVRRLF